MDDSLLYTNVFASSRSMQSLLKIIQQSRQRPKLLQNDADRDRFMDRPRFNQVTISHIVYHSVKYENVDQGFLFNSRNKRNSVSFDKISTLIGPRILMINLLSLKSLEMKLYGVYKY